MMDAPTKKLLEMKAQVIQAIGHPLRLAVVEFLANGEQCVCDIAQHLGAQRSNVSRHLSVMLDAGVLECRKDGLKMIYSLKTPCIMKFISCVTDVIRQQVEDQRAVLSRI